MPLSIHISGDSRNVFREKGLMMRAIDDFTIFNGFSCCDSSTPESDRDIDDFIQNDARQHFEDKIAVTYGLFSNAPKDEKHKNMVLGFATLQNDVIKIKKDGFDYPDLPAVKIGRFGIRKDVQRKGFGSSFLSMIRQFMNQPDNRTGCRFLTLNTYPNKRLINFYTKKNGFKIIAKKRSTDKQLIMYTDLILDFDPSKATRDQALAALHEPLGENRLFNRIQNQKQLFKAYINKNPSHKLLVVKNDFEEVAAEIAAKEYFKENYVYGQEPPTIEIVRLEKSAVDILIFRHFDCSK